MVGELRIHWPQARNFEQYTEFRERLRTEITNSDSVDIISGYVSASTASNFGHHLINVAKKGGRVRILIGMAGVEGLAKNTHDAWTSINNELRRFDSDSGVFAYSTKIHAKLYVFHNQDKSKMYTGSQNFNFSSGNMELMVEGELHPQVKEQMDYLFSDIKNLLPISAVRVKGITKEDIGRTKRIASISHHNLKLNPREMELIESINLRDISEKNPIGSLNLYHGRGRLNTSTGVYSPRPWYEVELTLGIHRYLGLPRDFTAYTDDGMVIEMQRRSGGPSGRPELGIKDLTSKGNRQLFGEWIKGKMERSGALALGDIVDGSTFDLFGYDHLEFYKISEKDFFMTFGVEE
jgi:hypothetical protein